MSFLAGLITEVLKDVLIVRAVRSRNRSFLIGFGVLTSIISLSLLFYLKSLPPTIVNDYLIKQIEYEVATSNSKDGSIILKSKTKDYSILTRIWQDDYDNNYVLEALNRSRTATVFVSSETSHTVMGITTDTFSINPEKGVEWDNKNRGGEIWLCWIFVALGMALILLVLVFY